ncbi:DNA internalization-related competence protein ComEC/Rec2 [Bacillus sp. AFS073361]|uniref:DNA internalization-related competence protein ComEC/Rec2 n=1 Tax=Bacillus sp. AFS073361 TaxID=2033511 RepID=UPI000BF4FF75|nr:DNA internalization-related competence protein ComEC/Rec2 [Bacillus sp. AFS073361]PFP25496.1 DNA internalization-related competence protein ComEC/Rec2 [Bacillus sp. AFS073361]
MNGKYLYFAIAALFGVLSALSKFLPFFLLQVFVLYLLYIYKRFSTLQLTSITVCFLIFFFIGLHSNSINKSVIPAPTTTFTLQYTQDPKIDGDLLQVQAIEQRYKERVLIRYKISSEQEKTNLKTEMFYQRLCTVSGTLEKPAIAKNPNAFNYRAYLMRKNIYWIIEVQENPLQHCIPLKPSPLVIIKQLRYTGINYLESHFPVEIASLSAALIFGDTNLFDPDVLSAYQKTGLVHLLAISGLHVSLLIAMVFYLGVRFGLTRQFMINFLLIILPIYVILTGSSPSVIRSGLMIFVVLLTVKWRTRLKLLPLDAISLAFIAYLIVSPMVVFDAGFQLSFAVSLVIILSANSILTDYANHLTRMLATSLVAQLGALPFLLYHYFEVSLIGIIANLVYIPLFSFLYLPGLYLLFFIQFIFGTTPPFLTKFFLIMITVANHLIEYLADFTFFHFTPGRPNLILLITYILLLLAIFYLWESKTYPKRKAFLIFLSIMLVISQKSWNWLSPYGEVTMIDVGQGDSILIHFPHSKGTYLIDTGGTMHFAEEKWRERAEPFEVGRDVVVPFLKGKGITQIDKLILTHGDMDHIGGTVSIIKELKVKQIIMPAVVEPSSTELDIIKEAKKLNIPVIKVSAGDQWTNEENGFFIVSPEKDYKGERNGGSIAFIAQLGGVSWFFGGDLDQAGEEKIIHQFPHLHIDVLKAGHHGSKTSSADTFINQIKPKVALISAGENNRFGHPHQEVLKRLEKTNTIIFRTDLQGAITYKFYHQKGTFYPYLP